jgi:phage-related protein
MSDLNAAIPFLPSSQTQGSYDPRTLETSYGNGYEQRSADGLNANLQKWNVLWENRSLTELGTVNTFFKSKGGYIAFTWTPLPPFDGTELRVKCKHWDWTYAGGQVVGITATLEEVAYP